MLKNLPETKVDVVERCAGHGGTFGVMIDTRKAAVKYGRTTARQIKNKKTKYVVSECPLASKHLDGLLNENTEYRIHYAYILVDTISNVTTRHQLKGSDEPRLN